MVGVERDEVVLHFDATYTLNLHWNQGFLVYAVVNYLPLVRVDLRGEFIFFLFLPYVVSWILYVLVVFYVYLRRNVALQSLNGLLMNRLYLNLGGLCLQYWLIFWSVFFDLELMRIVSYLMIQDLLTLEEILCFMLWLCLKIFKKWLFLCFFIIFIKFFFFIQLILSPFLRICFDWNTIMKLFASNLTVELLLHLLLLFIIFRHIVERSHSYDLSCLILGLD
jgi:hypothetical protein